MKLWVDDVRAAPQGYVWCRSVNGSIDFINACFNDLKAEIEIIDIDHDAGDYASEGGDYIKLLDWLEAMGFNIPIHIHSMNPVGIANMRRIIQRNGWTEV
jgi:hypothetical protein